MKRFAVEEALRQCYGWRLQHVCSWLRHRSRHNRNLAQARRPCNQRARPSLRSSPHPRQGACSLPVPRIQARDFFPDLRCLIATWTNSACSCVLRGLLLEARASPETADAAGRRPLGCAAATGNLKLHLDDSEKLSAFVHVSCMSGAGVSFYKRAWLELVVARLAEKMSR